MAEAAKVGGLSKPLTPSAELSAVTGKEPIARSEAVKKMWDYIKSKNLQDPKDKRSIIADEKLKPIFHGKDKVTMFEMNSHLAKHLK